MIKIASAVFVLLGLFVSGSRADYILKFIGETSGQTFEATAKQTETKERIDFLDYSIIQSSATNEAIVVLHANRIYFRVNLREIAERRFGTKTEEFKPTGKTQTINGYQTREFKGGWEGIQLTLFLTDTSPTERTFEKTMHNWINSHAAENFKDLLAMSEKLSGFPMRVVTESLGTNLTFTFESAQEANVDDREFVIPNDYTEFSFSGSSLPGLIGH